MKVLSLKLKDDIFKETEKVVRTVHIPRNTYINRALFLYNQLNRRRLLRRRLQKESQMVRPDSLEVLQEFEKLEDHLA